MLPPIKSLTIAGKRIIIKSAPLEGEWGHYDHDAATITLSDAITTRAQMLHWLRHETLHAALTISGVAEVLRDGAEEAAIRAMDEIFFPAWERVEKQFSKPTKETHEQKEPSASAP